MIGIFFAISVIVFCLYYRFLFIYIYICFVLNGCFKPGIPWDDPVTKKNMWKVKVSRGPILKIKILVVIVFGTGGRIGVTTT